MKHDSAVVVFLSINHLLHYQQFCLFIKSAVDVENIQIEREIYTYTEYTLLYLHFL